MAENFEQALRSIGRNANATPAETAELSRRMVNAAFHDAVAAHPCRQARIAFSARLRGRPSTDQPTITKETR